MLCESVICGERIKGRPKYRISAADLEAAGCARRHGVVMRRSQAPKKGISLPTCRERHDGPPRVPTVPDHRAWRAPRVPCHRLVTTRCAFPERAGVNLPMPHREVAYASVSGGESALLILC